MLDVVQATGRAVVFLLLTSISAGCYAPLTSPGVKASTLPDSFRAPVKLHGFDINFAMLRRSVPPEYLLGTDDLIRIDISDIQPFKGLEMSNTRGSDVNTRISPSSIEFRISAQNTILLPLVGQIDVGGLTLDQTRQKIVSAFSDGFLDSPEVTVSLIEKSTINVLVLGGVANPGLYKLPKYENDVAYAIANAGGLLDGQDEIQVHRRSQMDLAARESFPATHAATGFHAETAFPQQQPFMQQQPPNEPNYHLHFLRIPLRGTSQDMIQPEQAELEDGNVVVVRKLPDEVFFVVGSLSVNNQVRFNLGNENRDIGNGFVLPSDRDVDVITAVAMAGYIDPIDSPTTVTVHRSLPGGNPMLIHVNLIAARFDRKENIMVQSGDIIYLNPDPAWWFRRTFDRVLPTLITSPFTEGVQRLINPRGGN